MRILPGALVVGIAITLAACATTPGAPRPIVNQELLLRTDPAAAACSVMQEGAVVASVASTPGIAMVPRINAPIDVVCRKDGYLEQGMTFPVLPTAEVEYEQGATLGQASAMMAYGVTMAFPPIGLLTAPALAVAAARKPKPGSRYAYMTPPEFFLTPDTFASEAARDAFFDELKDKLQAAARVRHTYIDEHCRFWPCTPSDLVCRDPVCERQRALVDEQLQSQLDQIPALRARVRIPAAPGGLLLE
jgi:hypothetical protein